MSTTRISKQYVAGVVDNLPAYVEIIVTYRRGGQDCEHKLLTRDMPRKDRRLTSLTSGFEVMGIDGYLGTLSEMSESEPEVSFEFKATVSQ